MHGIQTSGNCVRNVTTDQWGGVAPDEIEDPRIWAEILRQHSTMHPEFTFLPRKFKIAITAAAHDRAAIKVHDIGLRLHRNGAGEIGFEVMVGGGLGRTPFIAKTIKPFLPKRDLLSYIEAILRVYNQYGRRDNIYKARIKILVHELGAEAFGKEVEAEWLAIKDGALALDPEFIAGIVARFHYPDYLQLEDNPRELTAARAAEQRFDRWLDNAVANHKVPGYAIVTLSLKPEGKPPGDATADQMDAIADLAERYSFGEIRVGHEQNLVLPHVAPARSAASFGVRSMRSALQRRMSVWSPISSPVPGSIIAVSPMRAPFRLRRNCRGVFAISTSPTISASCTSIFPAASTPAAIITSAISAFSASRRTARSSIRSRSAAVLMNMPNSARCLAPPSPMTTFPT